jgi:hypothetical protein
LGCAAVWRRIVRGVVFKGERGPMAKSRTSISTQLLKVTDRFNLV